MVEITLNCLHDGYFALLLLGWAYSTFIEHVHALWLLPRGGTYSPSIKA